MPDYAYKCQKCGRLRWVLCPVEDRNKPVLCDSDDCDGTGFRDFVATLRGARVGIAGEWNHPIHSEALAVHPEQRAEAIASAEKHGVPTEFDKHGCPIFRSRSHRKRYCKEYGFVDLSGRG